MYKIAEAVVVALLCCSMVSGYFSDYEFETKPQPTGPPKICGLPSDLVFVIDASSSIWPPHFRKQLEFINSVVNEFNVDGHGTGTRVGAITFSDSYAVDIQFNLNDYFKREQLSNAIKKIYQRAGQTYTNIALKKMRESMMTMREGARWDDDEVPKIAIVMTDGKSTLKEETIKQAKLAKEAGIRIMVIGIGDRRKNGLNIDINELNAIASEPTEKNVFHVKGGYDALNNIKRELAIKACEVKAKIPPWHDCGKKMQSDVAFVLGEATTRNPDKLRFYSQLVKNITKKFEVGPDAIQVAMVPEECKAPGFSFNQYQDMWSLHKHLDNVESKELYTTQSRIHHLVKSTFHHKNGARKNVRKLAVLVLDKDPEKLKSAYAAARAAKKHGIKIMTLAVSDEVSDKTLFSLASKPQYGLRFNQSAALNKNLRKLLYRVICKDKEEEDEDERGGYVDES
ncbi:collagen alpha-1(XII) chain [Lingula anatina]|uniref:Collagen alpha-1(XII) chain n=1 Tax=Lingula anatina TaxID=7574 RepID=A0A1S3JA92_LINAN|nr:collagen alpha-1(XII) chain [Lingula anatina]|eukprot:XP_013407116.1 collagen alpha-1(XII) chain [Lingula anatina]